MSVLLQPWQDLSVIVAGLLQEQRQRVIEILQKENRALKRRIGKWRLQSTCDARAEAAARIELRLG